MLFKVLNEDGTAFHGGTSKWHLPRDGQPGEWMPPVNGNLVLCENGYHLCRAQDLVNWLGPAIFEPEYCGERLDGNDKITVRQARLLRCFLSWDERVARLFACDCAERVLLIFESQYPKDTRPRQVIEVSRQYANDEVTMAELVSAKAAARVAAGIAAGAITEDAAGIAAGIAAGGTARVAAGNTARDAAGIMAEHMAGIAAENVAWVTVGDAVWNAAWDTARAIAWDAERKWQTQRLLEYLGCDGYNRASAAERGRGQVVE